MSWGRNFLLRCHDDCSLCELGCPYFSLGLRRFGNFFFNLFLINFLGPGRWSSQVAQMVKRLPMMPIMWETRVQFLGREDLLEKEMATHSSIFAWKPPWMVEPGRLQSMGSQRVGHDWATSLHFTSYSAIRWKARGEFHIEGTHTFTKCEQGLLLSNLLTTAIVERKKHKNEYLCWADESTNLEAYPN